MFNMKQLGYINILNILHYVSLDFKKESDYNFNTCS